MNKYLPNDSTSDWAGNFLEEKTFVFNEMAGMVTMAPILAENIN
jgi:hypothetical protein